MLFHWSFLSSVSCQRLRLNQLDIVPMNCYNLFQNNDIQTLEQYTQAAWFVNSGG